MSESRLGIGQHRVGMGGGSETGQRTRRDPAAVVGSHLSEGEEHSQNHGVPGSTAHDLGNSSRTVHGYEENARERATRHGKGDCK